MNDKCLFAVFPLPRIVAFPGHTLQFHIFEPRYRRMVRDCVDQKIPLGIAQGIPVKKTKSHAQQSVEEFLNSNQENYTPAEIFGAGPVSVVKEFPDGRFIIEVRIEVRIKAEEVIQKVPYLQVQGQELSEAPLDPAAEAEAISQVLGISRQLLGKRATVFQELAGFNEERHQGLSELIYAVLKWFVVEPEEGQRILETPNALDRAEILLAWMRYFLSRTEINRVQNESKLPDQKMARVISVDFHHKKPEPDDNPPEESKTV